MYFQQQEHCIVVQRQCSALSEAVKHARPFTLGGGMVSLASSPHDFFAIFHHLWGSAERFLFDNWMEICL